MSDDIALIMRSLDEPATNTATLTRDDDILKHGEPSKYNRYKCGYCGCTWDESDEALDCCRYEAQSEISMYRCQGCGENFGDEDNAIRCCYSPDKVDTFQCNHCEDSYDDLYEAQHCCDNCSCHNCTG